MSAQKPPRQGKLLASLLLGNLRAAVIAALVNIVVVYAIVTWAFAPPIDAQVGMYNAEKDSEHGLHGCRLYDVKFSVSGDVDNFKFTIQPSEWINYVAVIPPSDLENVGTTSDITPLSSDYFKLSAQGDCERSSLQSAQSNDVVRFTNSENRLTVWADNPPRDFRFEAFIEFSGMHSTGGSSFNGTIRFERLGIAVTKAFKFTTKAEVIPLGRAH